MELGKEQCFLDLITGVIDPGLRQRLVRYDPQSALDIGCGIGTTLVCLHYALGIDRLEGIEIQTADAVLSGYNSFARAELKSEFSTIEEVWLAVTTDSSDVRPRITDAEQMKGLLSISYDTSIGVCDFSGERYDLIILSNVLHYMYPHMIEHAFNKVRQLCHEHTLIYIRVKDDFKGSKVSSEVLLRYCRAFADERGLTEYAGGLSDEGAAFTFTNI